ncbi:hypothetical protein GCM10010260_82700 [Streptomyces filipinensis]|uniref:Uncharacterized protein n=1 Tax=Streptomyces filipinensis TaxID=66887 RepID=A0A918ILN5_9ACTN|nr:hypothetical protein GCM10010260_82700 [Streptomyces filipinensis]
MRSGRAVDGTGSSSGRTSLPSSILAGECDNRVITSAAWRSRPWLPPGAPTRIGKTLECLHVTDMFETRLESFPHTAHPRCVHGSRFRTAQLARAEDPSARLSPVASRRPQQEEYE